MKQTFSMKSGGIVYNMIVDAVNDATGMVIFETVLGLEKVRAVIEMPRPCIVHFVDFLLNRAKIEYPREENKTVSSMYGARLNYGIRPLEASSAELHILMDTPNVGVNAKMFLRVPSADEWRLFKGHLAKFDPVF